MPRSVNQSTSRVENNYDDGLRGAGRRKKKFRGWK